MGINTQKGFGAIIILLLVGVGLYYGYTYLDGDFSQANIEQKLDDLIGTTTEKLEQTITTVTEEAGSFDFSTFGETFNDVRQTQKPVVADISVTGIISATNNERIKEGQNLLTENTRLNASALVKARDIIARQYFEHDAPDGTTVSDLISNQGYVYLRVGENLARGDFKTNQEVVDAWMASPGHRANILNSSFTEIGIGITEGFYQGQQVWVLVQHFGTPRSFCPTIDQSLKNSIEQKENEINALEVELDQILQVVEEGRSEGKTMNKEAEEYNQKRLLYQSKIAEGNTLRALYNTQVRLFNTCLDQSGSQ